MKTLILADIHANLGALESILAAAESYDRIVFLGDLVNFGPHPAECLDLIRSKNAICVKGNHDEQALLQNPKHPWDAWSGRQLNEEQSDWLRNLPDSEVIDGHILALHGSYKVDYDILPNTPDDMIEKAFAPYIKPEIDEVWFGHYHYGIDRTINGITYRCFRAVGHHRDKDTRASYSVYENGQVKHYRVPYDVEALIEALYVMEGNIFKKPEHKEQNINFVRNAYDEELLAKDIKTMRENEENR